jgi:hypothetical protein
MLRRLALAVWFFACATLAQASEPDESLRLANGEVRVQQVSPDGIYFRLRNPSLPFAVEFANFHEGRLLQGALQDAQQSRAPVTIRYRADRFYSTKQGPIFFEVLSLTTAQGTINTERGFGPARTQPPGGLGMKDLALAVIQLSVSPKDARPHLDAALKYDLPTASRAFALEKRADLLWKLGDRTRPGADRDELHAAAVRDILDWRKIADRPNAGGPILAPLLRNLGAYEEAEAVYLRTLLEQPNRLGAYTGLAATYRAMGKPEQALKLLDQGLATGQLARGMPAYYQRAWALIELKRYAEAAIDLEKELQQEPQWAWAHLFRACALSATGRLPEAAAAAKRGAELIVAEPIDEDNAAEEERENEDARTMAANLEGLARTMPTTPDEAACRLFPGPEYPMRPRSPLLPPPQAW